MVKFEEIEIGETFLYRREIWRKVEPFKFRKTVCNAHKDELSGGGNFNPDEVTFIDDITLVTEVEQEWKKAVQQDRLFHFLTILARTTTKRSERNESTNEVSIFISERSAGSNNKKR